MRGTFMCWTGWLFSVGGGVIIGNMIAAHTKWHLALSYKRRDMFSVFTYKDFADLLQALVAEKLQNEGVSYRELSKQCGFRSSNYIQLILKGERQPKLDTVKRMVKVFDLDELSAEYFMLSYQVSQLDQKDETLASRMQQLEKQYNLQQVRDESIYSHWLHQVIWTLTEVKGERIDESLAQTRLKGIASSDDIRRSIDFLVKRGFIIPTGESGIYQQRPIKFDALNDKRRLELRQIHRRFLDFAKHKLNEDRQERYFQSVTLAIPEKYFPQMGEEFVKFINDMNEKYSNLETPDSVVHGLASFFRVTQPSDP